jgi:uncharacterized protein
MHDPEQNEQLRAVLAQISWRTRPERFVVAGLEPRERLLALRLLPGVTGAFWQLVAEPDMVTLVVAEAEWRAMSHAFPHARVERHYRAISFDMDLPNGLVGFMAAVSGALARAGVPLLAVCGYAKDHLLVREEYLDRALQAIEGLVGPQRLEIRD